MIYYPANRNGGCCNGGSYCKETTYAILRTHQGNRHSAEYPRPRGQDRAIHRRDGTPPRRKALIEEFGKDYGIYFSSILSAIARGLAERGQIENAVGAGALGGWWNRKSENEIDLIAESELDRTATFFEIKMDLQRYSPAELARKRDTFLRATSAYDGWKCDCRALSLANV